MTKGLEGFRDEVRRLKARSKENGLRYSVEMKSFCAEYGKSRVRDGVRPAKIALELGINVATLNKWMEMGDICKSRKSRGFRAVRVEQHKENESTELVTMVSPGGYRLEGLSIRNAALLLRELE